MKTRNGILFLVLAALVVALFVLDITTGSVRLTITQVCDALLGRADASTVKIVRNIRLLKAIAAMLCGVALSVSGLQMQTLFRNPLAGPYVLGITSGASLGVALFLLGMPLFAVMGISSPWFSQLGVVGAAWCGSAIILILVAVVAQRVRDIMAILILGMMFSAGVGAIVQILQYLSNDAALKSFVMWTMGSLADVTNTGICIMLVAVALGMLIAVATVKPLNLLLLGEQYASTMGLNIKRTRLLLFASTTLLAATVTAFCGPIGFVGLAVPHIARNFFRTSDSRILVPASALCGAAIMLLCDTLSKACTLPVNALTALLGIPIVIWIVLNNRNFTAR